MKSYRDFLDYLIKYMQGECDMVYGIRYQIDYAYKHKSLSIEEYDNLIAMLDDIDSEEDFL